MLSEELLQQAFGLDADIKSLDYFRIVCCIDYCGNKRKFKGIKKQIINFVIGTKFDDFDMIEKSTEAFLLICDLLSSPYISKAEKKAIAKAYLIAYQKENTSLKTEQIGQKASALTSYFSSEKEWFYAWKSKPEDIQKLLMRKELRTAY
ncbi:hypothetical protein [Alteromonas australica]|nr:hypothetical protein [Alteromonas australica]|tara:strand:- start:1611 stop:2057 length:447 start_codon:yes stop_codon:yes gene_type:complete